MAIFGAHNATLRDRLEMFAREAVCPVNESCQPGFVSGAYWGWGEARNRISQIAKEVPADKPYGVPESAVCFFKDGNQWCCVFGDFDNLQESPAGFGDTFEQALNRLQDCKNERAFDQANKGPSQDEGD